MTRNRIVIALGGNALQKDGKASASAQQNAADITAMTIAPLLKNKTEVAIVHGNGPQVGNIVIHEEAIDTVEVPTLPLNSGVAMSQGLIGYWLQQAFQGAFSVNGINSSIASIVTQVIVDKNDQAFLNPSKPIGPFYKDSTEAHDIAKKRNYQIVEDAGRGWRRVVPSPKPIKIVEISTIKKLIKSGVVVIAAGGGGVPVVKDNHKYIGIEAVIDKDHTAAMLANEINANKLIILTSIDAAMINFGKENQQKIKKATVSEMNEYIKQGHFAPGSMLPKIEAAIKFVSGGKKRQAIIASLDNAAEAMNGKSGTLIY